MTRTPNLFLAGAPKCGTTSMAFYLGQHPSIFAPTFKEPTYFGSDLVSQSRRMTLEEYEGLYESWDREAYALDASTAYFSSRVAAEEISAKSAKSKILMMVRNPIEASHSQYLQNRFDGVEYLKDFEASFLAQTERRNSNFIPEYGSLQRLLYNNIYSYVNNIDRFTKQFGRENVHVIVFDDFSADAEKSFEATLQFLGLEPDESIKFGVKNYSKRALLPSLSTFVAYPPRYLGILTSPFPKDLRMKVRQGIARLNSVSEVKPRLRRETKAMLVDHFAPEVRDLSQYLGRDLSHWLRTDD